MRALLLLAASCGSVILAAPLETAPPAHAQGAVNRLSPTISSLSSTPSGQRAQALAQFWKARRHGGGPLIEPASQPGYSLITFVYRNEPGVHRVVLEAPVEALMIASGQNLETLGTMTLLPDSDIWFLSLIARDDLRTSYRFLISREGENQQQARTDGLNAKRFAAGTREERSLLELDRAPAQSWVSTTPGAANRREGEWKQFYVPSKVYGEERVTHVYYPANYDPARKARYPVLIALRWASFGLAIPTGQIIESLATQGRIPPAVIVTAEMANEEDMAHLEKLTDYVAGELLPWLREHANVTRNPNSVVIAGTSRRGMGAAYVALMRPDAVRNVLSLSGAFYWSAQGEAEPEWLIRQYVKAPRRPIHFFLAAGQIETVVTPRNLGHYALSTTRHMRSVLEAKGYSICYQEYYGGHGEVNWQDAVDDGLACLMSPRVHGKGR
jgi:enterochelin esterase-like enzyme